MNFNGKMQAISDAFRKQYGTTDKYKLDDMPKLINGLEAKNLVDPGQSYDSQVDKVEYGMKPLTGMTVEKMNAYVGKPLLFSFDVEYSGYKPVSGGNRVGFEYAVKAKDGTQNWYGVWYYPKTANGTLHVVTMNAIDKPLESIDTAYIYNQFGTDAHVKITNIKIVVNPVGG